MVSHPMTDSQVETVFRQTGWPGLRAKLFHLYFVLSRPMTLGVRGLIFDRAANAVFLIRHTYVPGWQLPGGGVERGETMEEALTREIAEEANITLTAQPQLRSIHFNRRSTRATTSPSTSSRLSASLRPSCRTARSPRPVSFPSTACPTA